MSDEEKKTLEVLSDRAKAEVDSHAAELDRLITGWKKKKSNERYLGRWLTAKNLVSNETRKIRVTEAWHRFGSPRELCFKTSDSPDVWVAETIRAECELLGMSEQDTEVTVLQFREATRRMVGDRDKEGNETWWKSRTHNLPEK